MSRLTRHILNIVTPAVIFATACAAAPSPAAAQRPAPAAPLRVAKPDGAGSGPVWNWSPDAGYHHAVVSVGVPGASGTGTLISADPGIVVTAKHVTEDGGVIAQQAEFQWSNGYHATGQLIGHGTQTDLAFYSVNVAADSQTIPLADAMPTAGDTVEICGYGGPSGALRHFTGAVIASDANQMTIDAPVISGDSGGPIIHNGRLVAVNWGSRISADERVPFTSEEDGQPWPLVYPATGWGLGPMNRILTQQYCPPGSQYCPPQGQIRGGMFGFGRLQYIEPAPQPPPRSGPTKPPAAQPPAVQTPPVVPVPNTDAIEKQIADTIAKMDAIVLKIGKLKGCECDPAKACKCDEKPPPAPPPTRQAVTHYLVVGDPRGEYYARLKQEVEKAQAHHTHIRFEPAPQDRYVGKLPAIVLYSDAVSVETIRGMTKVSSELFKIINGDGK